MTSYLWLIVILALFRTVSEIWRLLGWNPYPRGRYSCSRSSKVIDLALNGKPIGDFLLVINCNLGPISHRLRDMASYWFKIAKFSCPLSFRALDWGDPYGIFGKALQILKLESLGSRWWRFDDPSLHRFCLIHPSDGQTELRWLRRTIAVPAVARKNLATALLLSLFS